MLLASSASGWACHGRSPRWALSSNRTSRDSTTAPRIRIRQPDFPVQYPTSWPCVATASTLLSRRVTGMRQVAVLPKTRRWLTSGLNPHITSKGVFPWCLEGDLLRR